MDIDTHDPVQMPGLLGRELVHPLEREIIRLRLPPGTKLVEEDICRRFGVSRSPVREALQVLEAHGLVERRLRRGMYVMPMTVARLDEIYSCRVPLEGLAAVGVANAASPEVVADMNSLVERMAVADREGRRDDAFDANVALTNLLHEHCGNETLQNILRGLDKQALRYRYYCYRETGEIIAADVEANAALIGAIAAHRSEEARSITEALVRQSWTLIRHVLAKHAQENAGDGA